MQRPAWVRVVLWVALANNVYLALLLLWARLVGPLFFGGRWDELPRWTLLAVASLLVQPPLLAVRWQDAPPASPQSIGAMRALIRAGVITVLVLGVLVWTIAPLAYVLREAKRAGVGLLVVVDAAPEVCLAPILNVLAFKAAWNWRPWARHRGTRPLPSPPRDEHGQRGAETAPRGA